MIPFHCWYTLIPENFRYTCFLYLSHIRCDIWYFLLFISSWYRWLIIISNHSKTVEHPLLTCAMIICNKSTLLIFEQGKSFPKKATLNLRNTIITNEESTVSLTTGMALLLSNSDCLTYFHDLFSPTYFHWPTFTKVTPQKWSLVPSSSGQLSLWEFLLELIELLGKACVRLNSRPQELEIFQGFPMAHPFLFDQVTDDNAGRARLTVVTVDKDATTVLSDLVNVVHALLKILGNVGGRPIRDAYPFVLKAGRIRTVDLFCHV